MDRRSLHKSRLESEALRRLESSTFLAASFDSHSPGKKPTRPLSAGNSRFAPVVKRPMSGKRQYMSAMENGYEELEIQTENLRNSQLKNGVQSTILEGAESNEVSKIDGQPSSLVTPGTNAQEGFIKVKKQNGNEVYKQFSL